MSVFINDINLDNFALFKAELILDIINEMDLNDNERSLVLDEIINELDDALMLQQHNLLLSFLNLYYLF